ncbi:hypothetical protein [Faecalicatena contorta]|uniref:hypothetical protein n=1 Tax=Faecalicatena contorta TaxID=39482 RepID=UPI0032175137
MWKIKVTREYKANDGFTLEDKMIFEAYDLNEIKEVIKIFDLYGTSKYKYRITKKEE